MDGNENTKSRWWTAAAAYELLAWAIRLGHPLGKGECSHTPWLGTTERLLQQMA